MISKPGHNTAFNQTGNNAGAFFIPACLPRWLRQALNNSFVNHHFSSSVTFAAL
jgi:hypothetical protein